MRVRGDIRARFEVKSVAADNGAFEGYGAVLNVVDIRRCGSAYETVRR